MKRRFAISYPHVAAAAQRWRVKCDATTVWRWWLPALALAFQLSHNPSAHGQDDLFDSPSASANGLAPAAISEFDPNVLEAREDPDPISKSLRQSGEKLARLKDKLNEALNLKDDKSIASVKEEVNDALTDHFAHDFAVRESVLARLTKRADKAAALNKQRLASKDELIELQLRTYVIERDSIGASEGDVELQNLFGSGRQSTPSDVPGTALNPDSTALNPDSNGFSDLVFEAPSENEVRVFIASDNESELSVKMQTVLEGREIWLRGVHSGPLFSQGDCTNATVVESPEGLIGIRIAFQPNVLEKLRNFTQYSPDALFAVAPTKGMTIHTVMTFVKWLDPDIALFDGFRDLANAEMVAAMLRKPISRSPTADSPDPDAVSAADVLSFHDATSAQRNRTSTIEAARIKLARASSADEESQATLELRSALEAYFDRDLEERNRLLKTVRADIEKMKQKLEKRASSKESIIELQFKIFVNEASGLGFFSPPLTTGRFGEDSSAFGGSQMPELLYPPESR